MGSFRKCTYIAEGQNQTSKSDQIYWEGRGKESRKERNKSINPDKALGLLHSGDVQPMKKKGGMRKKNLQKAESFTENVFHHRH